MAGAAMIRLEYRNVTMTFAQRGDAGGITAVRDVSFSVADQEVVSLIGPSGCGKSTLLNIGSGLSTPTQGAAYIDDARFESPNVHVAFMLQKDLLLPWRTIEENVMLGVEIQRCDPVDTKLRVALVSPSSQTTIPISYQAACANGQRSRVPLPLILRCCCLMSHSRRWTRKRASFCNTILRGR
jgi:NitT/TauT family transport system ATP-binding protein